ncbi:hyalin-like [Amphiura filiformis]|uniref:hyalin-like n=1 Tax=Amphiura filiformis TaxID=82378 RepID=UPI003B219B8F
MILDNWATLLVALSGICLVNCQVCVLKQRPDPSQRGTLRWSLSYNERCFCQAVVAPRPPTQACNGVDEYAEDIKLWYVDDPRPLINRINWTKEALDKLLDRAEYCGRNECDSNPCEHRGTCHDRIGKYICTCLGGYSGDRCEMDYEAPVIVNVPESIIQVTDPEMPTAVVIWIPPTGIDNSGSQTLTSSHIPGTVFPIGVTRVTYYSTDDAGNTVTSSFTVTIQDHEKPVIDNMPANIIQDTDPGMSTATVIWTLPTGSDNSGSQTLASSHTPGSSFPTGVTIVTYNSTDAAGITVTSSFTVTIQDHEKPVINNVPTNKIQDTDPGMATAVVTWASPTGSDNSGSQTLTSSHTPGTSLPIGVTIVMYNSTDDAGNTGTSSFTVTIQDAENPVIGNVPANIIQDTDTGMSIATVIWTLPTGSDNSGSQTLASSHTSGSSFPIGVTIVTYNLTDDAGNTVTSSFSVTIQDHEKPVIDNMPANIIQDTDPGMSTATVIWTLPTGSDNSGSQTLASSHTPGSSFPIGVTIVTFNTTDDAGNTGTSSFTVTIQDHEKPVIDNVPANMIQETDPGMPIATVAWTLPTGSDNSGSQTLTSSHTSGSLFPIGVMIVMYNSTDDAGNMITSSFTVTIQDGENPVIDNVPENIIQYTDPGMSTAIVTWTSPTSSDNSGSQTLTSSHTPGTSFPIGVTIVTYNSTDDAGNTMTSSFNVTIKDNEDLIIGNVPANIIQNAVLGMVTAVVTWIPPTGSEHSGSQTLTSSHTPGSSFPIGVTRVTYNLTDDAGNTVTSSFTVTIQDSRCPQEEFQMALNFSLTIQSPEYPSNYLVDTVCEWTVTPAAMRRVLVQFLDFDLEFGYDVLYIGITDKPRSLQYTGNPGNQILPSPILSSVNEKLLFEFTSDHIITQRGFSLLLKDVTNNEGTSTCADNWKPFGNHCYYFAESARVNFSQAQAECQSMGANLTSIHSQEEQNFIGLNTEEGCWIGLHDQETENTFVWTDGTMNDYTNWASGEPNDNYCNEDCVGNFQHSRFYDGYYYGPFPEDCDSSSYFWNDYASSYFSSELWNDFACDRLLRFVCKQETNSSVWQAISTLYINKRNFHGITELEGSGMILDNRATLLVALLVICLVNGQVCVLKQRPDPSQRSTLRWSLSYNERCFCQAVVAPRPPTQACNGVDEYAENMKLWYVDDPRPLINRINWTKEALDKLLDRAEYCGRNECDSNPCKHSGTCHDRIGKYICTCLDGYSGDRCEMDYEIPVIVNVPESVIQVTDPEMPTAIVIWIPPTGSDNSGSQTLTSSHTPGSSFPIGVTKVTYNSTDDAGNTGTSSFTVTIQDSEKPVIGNEPPNIIQYTDPGMSAAIATWTPPTGSDNSGSQTLTSSHTPGLSFPIGVTIVTYNSTDAAGNIMTSSFTVTIQDHEKPVIDNVPSNIIQDTDTGMATAIVTWASPTGSDNSGSQTLTSSHTPGLSFPIGVTIVTYNSTDGAGNTGTSSFAVTIQDNEKPVIGNEPPNIIQYTDPGMSAAIATWTPPTGRDNSGSQTLTSSHTPGLSFPIGVTIVTYNATDAAGNTVTSSFTVTIQDGENPVIGNAPANIIQDTDPGMATANVTWTSPTASDNSGSQTLTSSHTPGLSFPIGVTIVTYNATDCTGNTVTSSFTVTIQDHEKPVIDNVPANIIQETDPGMSSATVAWTLPTGSDNSGSQTLTSSHTPGLSFPIGVTIVTYNSTDCAGNTVTSSFTVTIQDNEDLIIGNVPANIIQNADLGMVTALVTWTSPTGSNNSDSQTLTSSHTPASLFPIGVTIVTYTLTDDAGNTVTSSFTVTIQDIRCPQEEFQMGLNSSLTIQSPAYPSNYLVDMVCDWTVTSVAMRRVLVQFLDFDLEFGWDFLYIGITDKPRSVQYTGNETLPSPILSSINETLLFEFTSDSTITHRGFSLLLTDAANNHDNEGENYELIYFLSQGFRSKLDYCEEKNAMSIVYILLIVFSI